MDKLTVLREYFGHSSFRAGQAEIIDEILSGRDVLAVMPTGGGKSMCYQIPALMFEGITVVISPLISLMKDQVQALVQSGVRAAYINSSLTQSQYMKVISNIRAGVYKIIYVSPERLEIDSFLSCCEELDISFVAVDEAHCVSCWGQDFRPAYLSIARFVDFLPRRPIVGAFTATATDKVKADIVKMLRLSSPFEIVTGFDRPNLYFEVIQTSKKEKNTELIRLMRERYGNKCGIIYCGTRNAVEEVCSLLTENGFPAEFYHAGMRDEDRHRVQDDFIYDRVNIIVATNAFGMGIDKSNVSFVIHYNMPKNIESYYQEAGRAGRDGRESDCVMLYSSADTVLNRFLIERSEPNPDLTPEESERILRLDFDRLAKMEGYCHTLGCLRAYLLSYFGETSPERCEKCSNCTGEFLLEEITVDAQKILSCIARTENRYGASTISAILRASMNEIIERHGLDSLSTYGIMRGISDKYIRRVINELLYRGYLVLDEDSVYKIPALSEKARPVLLGRERVYMKKEDVGENREKRKKRTRDTSPISEENLGLLESLKKLRLDFAREKGVPAYIVFTDSALDDMCRVMPTDIDEFLTVSGVGKAKAAAYGEAFLEVIGRFK